MNSRLELKAKFTKQIEKLHERERTAQQELDLIRAELARRKALRITVDEMSAEVVSAYLNAFVPPEIFDPGILRYGDSCITAEFPAWRGVVAELPPKCK